MLHEVPSLVQIAKFSKLAWCVHSQLEQSSLEDIDVSRSSFGQWICETAREKHSLRHVDTASWAICYWKPISENKQQLFPLILKLWKQWSLAITVQ